MKKLFELAEQKGYKVHNKRVMGNPEYTSETVRIRDSVQEMALLQLWLREQHAVNLYVSPDATAAYDPLRCTYYGVIIHEGDTTETPVGSTHIIAWEKCLESALKMIK